jgi:hypothetical protein
VPLGHDTCMQRVGSISEASSDDRVILQSRRRSVPSSDDRGIGRSRNRTYVPNQSYDPKNIYLRTNSFVF